MTVASHIPPPITAARIEELGRIILAYSEVTNRLEQSHEQLKKTVQKLQEELGEKNRQLERKNRLAALGEMAAGMAHEIRNPLGGIQLYASILAKDLTEQPASLDLVRKISSGVRRLESLVSHVLHFTREIKAQPAVTDVAAIVEEAVALASPAIEKAGAACVLDGPKPMQASVDGLLLGQAVLNLLINAAEAMQSAPSVKAEQTPDSGPAIRDAASVCENGSTRQSASMCEKASIREGSSIRSTRDIVIRFGPGEAGRQLRLSVRDAGPGVPADVMDRLFNPFFTTKDTGTGLGLSIVHRIVEAHDGTITVTNPPGGGAMFEMKI
jgi:signal transduction histidine kinase